jgi:hypothetical protein
MKRKKIAITVSKNYHDELKLSIEHNAKHFDKWYIITQSDDIKSIDIIAQSGASNIDTVLFPLVHSGELDLPAYLEQYKKPMDDEDLFISRPWAKNMEKPKRQPLFEKGLAMRYVQKYLLGDVNDDDLIICMDTDVILPKNFSDKLEEREFKKETLYGCRRKEFLFLDDFINDENIFASSPNWEICAGFLQIYLGYHCAKKNSTKPARFTNSTTVKYFKRTRTCSWTDWEFKCQFQQIEELPFVVSHLGSDSLNWKGKKVKTFYINSPPKEDKVEIFKKIDKARHEYTKYQEEKREKSTEGFSPPSFIIPGFQKCGTSALSGILNQHPQICMPKSKDPIGPESEINYFCTRNQLGKDWFLSHFPDNGMTYGMKSPNSTILYHQPWMPRVSAQRIFADSPNSKIIFLLRDPVERAFSAYCHFRFEGFYNADELSFNHFLTRRRKYGKKIGFFNLFTPDYEYTLSNYYNLFSKKRILLISQEQLFTNHEEEVRKIFSFLGVKNTEVKRLSWHQGKDYYNKDNILFEDESRQILTEQCRPMVNLISDKYPIDTSLWKNFN